MTQIRIKLKVDRLEHVSLQPEVGIELNLIILSALASSSHQPFSC